MTPPTPHGRIGVLLLNLGSPDAPTPAALRRYLAQFLSDRRVVEIPPLLWQPILRGLILTLRPRKSAAIYAEVWDRAHDESPLKLITRRQAEALPELLPAGLIVDQAMRYGQPSIAAGLHRLRDAGADRILIAPLYPQYCAATTGTALAEVHRVVGGMRWMPALRTLPPYHDHPAYIAALARSIRRQLQALPFQPERLLVSFHGMPRRTRDLGDPYYHHCQQTTRLLREALGMDAQTMPIAFQSRFGRAEWLQPYTEPLLRDMAGQGVRRVAVITPGFAADCVETLEEIAIRARQAFIHAGGEQFVALSCLNASEEGMEMLRDLLLPELAGWAPPG